MNPFDINPFEIDNPFEIKEEEPKLYIADVTVKFNIKGSFKIIDNKTVPIYTFKTFTKVPIILLNGNPPSQGYKNKLIEQYKSRVTSNVENSLSIEKIENIKFSSKLGYKFDFNQ
jgi:hypothetical protein